MRLAIFDMDGTLIDTIGDIHACLNRTLTVYGYAPVDLESTKRYVGNGMRQLVINAVGEANFTDQMETYFRAIYKDNMMNTTKTIDGITDILEYLDGAGVRAVVLSNKIRPIVNDMVNYFKISKYFWNWYGGDSFGVKKPSPVPVEGIMDKHRARPEETIMIGDSSSDILAGAQAGAKTCFCAYGYGTLKNGLEPDYTAKAPHELIKILEDFRC